MADTRVGRYRLVRRVGRGGMAEVWEAAAEGPGGFAKQVALKRILPHLCDDEALVTMFEDEAHLASRLTHRHVAQVFDYGLHHGVPYLVMEWVGGRDLRRVLQALEAAGERLTVPQVVEIGRTVAAALAHAHALTDARGVPLEVVHRDVSPQNVLVSFEGEVKLADFGIAKAAHRRTHTGVGVLKGKAAYMSPEQARGLPVDRRSDLFSLGVVLWECLCGRDLFTGDTDLEVLRAILETEAPPPSSLVPEVPAALDGLVMRCLAKRPVDRFPSAGEVELALGDLALDQGWSGRDLALAPLMGRLFSQETGGRVRGTARLPAPPGGPGTAPADSLGLSIDVVDPEERPTRVTRLQGDPPTGTAPLPDPGTTRPARTAPVVDAPPAMGAPPPPGATRPLGLDDPGPPPGPQAAPLASTRASVSVRVAGVAAAAVLLGLGAVAIVGSHREPPHPPWIPPTAPSHTAWARGEGAGWPPTPAPSPDTQVEAPRAEALQEPTTRPSPPARSPSAVQASATVPRRERAPPTRVARQAPSDPRPPPRDQRPAEPRAASPGPAAPAGGVVALGGSASRSDGARVPTGTVLELRLDDAVGEAEPCTAVLERSVILHGAVLLRRGTRFSGRTRREGARLLVTFDEVRLPDGTRRSTAARAVDRGTPGVPLPGGEALAELVPAQLPRGTRLTVVLTAPLLMEEGD